MVPSVPHQGPADQQQADGSRTPGSGTPGWRRAVIVAGAVLAVVSVAAWAVTLGVAAAGGDAPAWVGALALYGLPVAFVLMGVAIVGAVLERRHG